MKMNLKKAHKLVASIKGAVITAPNENIINAAATIENVKEALSRFDTNYRKYLYDLEIQNRLVFRIRKLISVANSTATINNNTIDAALNEMEMTKVQLQQLQGFAVKPVSRDVLTEIVQNAEASAKSEYGDRLTRINNVQQLSEELREEKFKETRAVKDKIESLKDYVQMANSTISIEIPFSAEEEEFLKEFAII